MQPIWQMSKGVEIYLLSSQRGYKHPLKSCIQGDARGYNSGHCFQGNLCKGETGPLFLPAAYPQGRKQWLSYNYRWQDAHRLPIVPSFPSPCAQHLPFFLSLVLERTLEPARLKGAHGEQTLCLASGWRRVGVPPASQHHTRLCAALVITGDSWSLLLPSGCTGIFGLSSGSRRKMLSCCQGKQHFFPLFMYVFSEPEGKSKWRGKTSIDGTDRREKRAFCLTKRPDLSVVASRTLKKMCFACICCR